MMNADHDGYDADTHEDYFVCRICLNSVNSEENIFKIDDYPKTSNFDNLQIKEIIERTVPEMDLDICESSIICLSCYDLLIKSYMFKSKCYQTEERIYLYLETNKFNIGDKIDLKLVTKKSNAAQTQKRPTVEVVKTSRNLEIKSEVIEDTEMSDVTEDGNKTKRSRTRTESDSDNLSYTSSDDEQSHQKQLPSRSNLKRSYSCAKCEYKGYRLDLLKRHMKKCESKDKKGKLEMFKCNSCPYSTCRKRNLKRHLLTHGGERPYTCGICNKGFTEMNHIKSHMYKHSSAPLPFQCKEPGCSSGFSRRCDLNAHMVTHVDQCKQICEVCKKGFYYKVQLANHMKRHHREEDN